MNALAARSALRSLAGLVGVGIALAALVIFVPGGEEEPAAPFAPGGASVVETVALDGDRTVRLWMGPSGWWVQSLVDGEHQGAAGASGVGGYEYSAGVLLDGLVGTVPVAGARTVEVRPEGGGAAVRATLHDRFFLMPASFLPAGGRAVLMTPYGAAGEPLGAAVTVPLTGR